MKYICSCASEVGKLCEACQALHAVTLMDILKISDGNFECLSQALSGPREKLINKTMISKRTTNKNFDFHIIDTPLVHSIETGRRSQRDRTKEGSSSRLLKIDTLCITIRARTLELFVDKFIVMHELECVRVLANYPDVLRTIIIEYAQNDVLDWFHLLALFFGYKLEEDGRKVYDSNPELKIANFMIQNGSKKRKRK